jgi:hypothetical protein
MTNIELDALSDEELTELAFSSGWRWSIRVLGIAGILSLVGIVGLFVLRGADQAEATRKNAQAAVDESYRSCLTANVSRADLRDVRDFIANPTPFDLNQLPAEAVEREPLLIGALKVQQAKAADFRERHKDSWQARDCDAEKTAALSARGLDP